MRYAFLAAAAAALLASCGNPVYRIGEEPLPVASIEQARYLGLWHEQARLPTWFQEGCQLVTAEYGVRDDGMISVTNRCTTVDGRERVANARARFVGEPGEG